MSEMRKGTRLSIAAATVTCLMVLLSTAHADEVQPGTRASSSFLTSNSFSFAAGILVNRNADPDVTYAGSVLNPTSLVAAGIFEYRLSHDKKISAPDQVPEPGTLALVGTAVLGLAGLLRRKLHA